MRRVANPQCLHPSQGRQRRIITSKHHGTHRNRSGRLCGAPFSDSTRLPALTIAVTVPLLHRMAP